MVALPATGFGVGETDECCAVNVWDPSQFVRLRRLR